ncbi:acyl-CoA carboxylase subunit beta [Pseudonocardia nigra]|uniref:acyl-CoA carboxylase subunit beta n=1 Tax=Pseudonocardia nigra TaxID=1921578 RepID=UPI001C5F7D39|nr:carboxyl transferase domain-containing protein [Pseudonocardia nigra]
MTGAGQDRLAELERRRKLALRMGGPEGIARQHEHGKLTVRERIEELTDPGSFREFGLLAGSAAYDDGQLVDFTPKASVDGIGRLDGRKIVISGGDFTVRGGSAGGAHGALGAELAANERALQWRLPYVRLLDAVGGSVRSFEELGRTYLPDGNIWSTVDVELLNTVPVVSAVMGSVAGLPAVNACLAHWNVMVRGTAQLFPGGPPVVKAALGYDISKEELGGAQVHAGHSGVIDNLAETEKDALAQVRRFLSYLPASVDELPPQRRPRNPVGAADELRTLIPDNRRSPFDARRLLDLVLDEDSFFEIAPHYGRSRLTGLARVDGRPIGVMANNPMHLGGSTDVASGEKVMRLVQLCEVFHLPLVSFADEPGFMVGLDSEKQGIERAGARLVWTICQSRLPLITFVIGRLFGVAGQCHHRPSGMFRRYAWPSAAWGSMHITGGASAAYRREIESAADPQAKRAEIERRLQAIASPFRTAEATGQDIIDPAETRELLAEFVHDAQRVLAGQLGPPRLPYRP